MSEYIDREALMRKIRWADSVEEVFVSIRRMPAADVVQVRHGKWIMESGGGTRCSYCNQRVHDVIDGSYAPVDLSEMPYCPKCGAKMDGVDGDE